MTSIRFMIVLNTVQFNLGFTIHYRNFKSHELSDIGSTYEKNSRFTLYGYFDVIEYP